MEVSFRPEILDELKQVAAHSGKSAEQLVEEITTRALLARTLLLGGVARGRADIENGNVVEHEAVMRQVDELLES